MKIMTMALGDMKPALYNPRKDLKPGDPEYEHLKKSFQAFDYVDPIIVNRRTGNIVAVISDIRYCASLDTPRQW